MVVAGTVAGCRKETAQNAPAPFALTEGAIGHYCGMNLTEHAGPKGQIILSSRQEPVWFSSARDTISFTMLPDEPKDIRAIYVSDMAKAASWQDPGATNWVDARKALFVIESRLKGGMGAAEAVPFSGQAEAERFVAENGGRIVAFDQIPRDYILAPAEPDPSGHPQHRH
ncbi:nitrous oxide reductase accessory protein NosL [Reyranella sp.]|uniref:nitrous oxide reductase accessory protein NosL n=1 Tax=Reyranella sp. TaxID=1929291 RepID=UPI00378417CD